MRIRSLLSVILSVALIVTTTPLRAEMIGTDQILTQEAHATQLAQVQGFMAREDVRKQMASLGVDPAVAAKRVAAMTDSELQQVSRNIQDAPAGAGVVELVLVVLLILILLELVGAINIFTRI